MGETARAAGVLAAGVCAGLLLAGCGVGSAPGPTDAQIDEATVPSVVVSPNDDSATGGCALITPEQVAAATGAAVTRTSGVGEGCAWSDDEDGGRLVAELRVLGNEDGDSARTFENVLATQKAVGPVQLVSGLGLQAFTGETEAPAVWWEQNELVYTVAVASAPGDAAGVDAALALARIATANLAG